MPPAEFEPAIPASERPQTHALDRSATEIDRLHMYRSYNLKSYKQSATLLIRVIYSSVLQFEPWRFKTSG